MLRELILVVISGVFLLTSTTDWENPGGKCYTYNNGSKPAPLNCCDRSRQENPCDTIDCQNGRICELVYSSTTEEPCSDDDPPFKPQCRVVCDSPKSCNEGCYLVEDNNGCNFCYCEPKFENPCLKENACNGSQACSLRQVRQCFAPPCYPSMICSPIFHCPLIQKCQTNCLQYKDSDGCPKCHCCNPCVNQKCPRGKKCVLGKVTCVRCPCLPSATCE